MKRRPDRMWPLARDTHLEKVGWRCEMGPILAEIGIRSCRGRATTCHHVSPRGMGGRSAPDRHDDILATCDPCHTFVESNRKIGYALGLLKRRS